LKPPQKTQVKSNQSKKKKEKTILCWEKERKKKNSCLQFFGAGHGQKDNKHKTQNLWYSVGVNFRYSEEEEEEEGVEEEEEEDKKGQLVKI